MATQARNAVNFLYLDRAVLHSNLGHTTNLVGHIEITLKEVIHSKYSLDLFVGNRKIELEEVRYPTWIHNPTWEPVQRSDMPPTSEMHVDVKRTTRLPFLAKSRQTNEVIDLQGLFKVYWGSKEHKFTVLKDIVIGKNHVNLELWFSANDNAESLRSSIQELEGLMNGFIPLMSRSVERTLGKAIQLGTVFAEFDPIAKAVLDAVKVIFKLMSQQNKYDQMPSSLFGQLQRILPLANKHAGVIVLEETEILETIMPRIFKVIQKIAKFLCDYVKQKTGVPPFSPKDKDCMKEMDEELAIVIKDFLNAMNAEPLRRAKRIEQGLIHKRLKPIDTGYDLNPRCMQGTRRFRLEEIENWVANKQEGKDLLQTNTYWIYGLPGIGKTSLAHSICARLHDRRQFVGAFFCQRGDPNLSEPINILPTLIYKLAEKFPPFRKIVTDYLRSDPNPTPDWMEGSLFLDFLDKLPRGPNESLVFVIDAFDECGNHSSRPALLTLLTRAAASTSWLKLIITSRPEADIQRVFDSLSRSSYLRYDLAEDQEASHDLRTFAQSEFGLVAQQWGLSPPWPEESLLDRIISRSNGLFIFIKTFALALEHFPEPTGFLEATHEAGDGLKPLYGLYSNILNSRMVRCNAEFQRVIGVLLLAAPYRALCAEAIGELAGVAPNLVKKLVKDARPFLYRDEGTNGGIHVRHLSILEFLVSDDCPCDYRISLRDSNVNLGIACLKTMVSQLRFNICGLEDSRLANADIEDLPSRVRENISASLQYSSLYWSIHICSTPDKNDPRVWESLKEFFEGLCPLFWVEVLSLMGMVPMGVPSIRRVISWAKEGDSTLLERLDDICRFIVAFQTPISISAPHTYVSTRPFLPSNSTLSTTFSTRFIKCIKMVRGELSSWPAPPLEWIGHTGAITCLSYSPDGLKIISGSIDMTIRIWDAGTGAAVGNSLEGHTARVVSVAHSPDGQHITSGSTDKTIRIWDADTGAAVGNPLEGHTSEVWSVAYSPDGRHIISGSYDQTVRIWDAETGTAIGRPLEGHTSAVGSVAYSPDGRHIISGSYDKTVRIWDAATGAAVGNPLKGHTDWVGSVAYSPDGRHIISGSHDKTIRIWDAEAGAAVGSPLEGHTDWVFSVAYSPDGRYIISGSGDQTIRIWDAETGAAVGNRLDVHSYGVFPVAYSPDGRYITFGTSDKTIQIWHAETGAAADRPLEGDTTIGPSAAGYSPNGQHFISGSNGNTIRLWESISHEPPSYNPIDACVYSRPDSQGWVRDSHGGLLYWVPLDCRINLHSPALITIPLMSVIRSVFLDFEEFAFGTAWTQIFNSAQA